MGTDSGSTDTRQAQCSTLRTSAADTYTRTRTRGEPTHRPNSDSATQTGRSEPIAAKRRKRAHMQSTAHRTLHSTCTCETEGTNTTRCQRAHDYPQQHRIEQRRQHRDRTKNRSTERTAAPTCQRVSGPCRRPIAASRGVSSGVQARQFIRGGLKVTTPRVPDPAAQSLSPIR